MATRGGGRNDDRSSQRNTGTGQRSTTGSSGGARSASGSGGRGTASTSGSRGGASGGGTSGRSASTIGGTTSGTRSRGPSGTRSTQSAGLGGSSASSPAVGSGLNQSESAGPSTYSTDAPATPSGSSAAQSSPTQGASSSGTGFSTSADREREVRTSREVGGSSRPVSSAARSGIGRQQQGGNFPSQLLSGGGNTPFAMMRRMMDDMDRLFSEFGFIHPGQIASGLLSGDFWPSSHAAPRSLGAASSGRSSVAPQQPRGQQGLQRGIQGSGLPSLQGLGLWSPQVEMFERGNNLVVRADLPGLSREDVDVEVDDDALIIRGERRNELDDEQEGYYRSERSYGSFYRAIPLPDNVDPTSCQATFKDGVLEITLPKPQQSITKAKRIEVR